MDRRSEELIRSRILAARPSDAILGEEGGLIGNADDAPVLWVIDPLDGTVNYLYGLHDWAVSIAAEVADGRARAEGGGSAEDRGRRGVRAGARRAVQRRRGRRRRARVRGGERVRAALQHRRAAERALIGTGFGYLAGAAPGPGRGRRRDAAQVRDIRRIGVASVDLCAVAAGRLDGFYERGLNYWDWAAGALVATEAGAHRRRPGRQAGLQSHGGSRRARPLRPAHRGTGRARPRARRLTPPPRRG